MYSILLSYKNFILQILLSISLSLLLHFLSLSSFFLSGLNTYIHPDDVNPSKPQSGPKVAIRRPSDINSNPNSNSNQGLNGFQSLSSKTASELRNRKKPPKEKFEFDESKAQIFRLKLGDAQIHSRLYFDSYRSCFNCFVVSSSCFLLQNYLKNVDDHDGSGILINGSLVPIVIGVLGLFRVLISIFRVSIERSAFRRSERQLGLVFGFLGFFLVLVICLGVYPWVLDFEFSSIDGFGISFIAILAGLITGFLYLAAGKNARAFWLGTDQIRCNLPIISCGWFAQMLFYANYLTLAFTSMLWIKPFAEIFVNKNIGAGRRASGGHREKLVGNMGISEADFVNFRLLCLLFSGVLQVLSLRSNVQTYLNEAVLSWYQRLHSSMVPDLEYSRAKVFLHNHYLCLAAIQFLAPGALILLSLGMSQVDGGLFENFQVACGMLPCSAFVKEVAIFLAWWVACVWFVFTSAHLAFYRRGIMYVS